MKIKQYIILLYLITTVLTVNGQIILDNFNSSIPCCSYFPISPYIDSFDVDNDNSPEFWIQARTFLDELAYTGYGSSTTELNEVILFGEPYSDNKWGPGAYGLPGTSFAYWAWWPPNTGYKYLGFRIFNSNADTTYGWVKLDFRGDTVNPILDTLFILDYAYSTIPNIPLYAGQTIVSSVIESETNKLYKIYPNPFVSNLNIDNESSVSLSISLIDLNGKLQSSWRLQPGSKNTINLSFLESGMYFLNINSDSDQKSYKVVKQ